MVVEEPDPKSPPDRNAVIALIQSSGIPLGVLAILLALWGLHDRHLYDWMSGLPTDAIVGGTSTYMISGLWILMGIFFIVLGLRAKRSGIRGTT